MKSQAAKGRRGLLRRGGKVLRERAITIVLKTGKAAVSGFTGKAFMASRVSRRVGICKGYMPDKTAVCLCLDTKSVVEMESS